eukprot:358514-Chlamydomonas_euryale.AAC.10
MPAQLADVLDGRVTLDDVSAVLNECIARAEELRQQVWRPAWKILWKPHGHARACSRRCWRAGEGPRPAVLLPPVFPAKAFVAGSPSCNADVHAHSALLPVLACAPPPPHVLPLPPHTRGVCFVLCFETLCMPKTRTRAAAAAAELECDAARRAGAHVARNGRDARVRCALCQGRRARTASVAPAPRSCRGHGRPAAAAAAAAAVAHAHGAGRRHRRSDAASGAAAACIRPRV